MPISNVIQPEILEIDDSLRLRKFDHVYDFALEWYQDEETVWMMDGNRVPYDTDRLSRMYRYLDEHGELYWIEVKMDDRFVPIGDVTLWREDLPITIGPRSFRGRGIGKRVVRRLMERSRELDFDAVQVDSVFSYNIASQRTFESLGFEKNVDPQTGNCSYFFSLEGEQKHV